MLGITFFTEIMRETGIDIEPSVEKFLLSKDKNKMGKFKRDHDNTIKAKQKENFHAKLRKELEVRYKDIAKNMEYCPMVGCDAGVENKGRNKDKPGLKICWHMLYGCTGGVNARTAHKSEASRFCTFSCKSKDEIREIRDKYFLDHPEV